ncbi:electron transfer flavoprotein subunit alpha/FixB family protein [Dongia sedimenti]|uniref:Electron transfer flavoprotein subunit alpha/FixB family protein n=1 Tax=Dongia sedimenti TaxID=3064282 RepID=A0ABU0YTB1_9PROT|nr:electron transfer flavoprotein subunit alpha/FixB family protein [Rhodospirillaceae bacterium R-7]
MKIIACAEARADRIEPVSFEMIEAARSLAGDGDEVIVFFAGKPAADAAVAFGAADRLVAAHSDEAELVPAESYARILREVIAAEDAALVLVPYSASGLDIAAEVAARKGWPLVAYVNAVTHDADGIRATAQMYGGKLLAECQVTLPAVLMVNPGAFAEAVPAALAANKVREIDASGHVRNGKVKLVAVELPDPADVDLATAERIVCVGRGVGDAGNIDPVRNLAALLNAEIAGSRPVVDSGWLPRARQVGKSGRKVKPKLYFALGVSGAPEHLEGMAQAGVIVAVNTDANAPIFNVAHYGVTCDLSELVETLTEKLQAASG